ncbi:MAG: cation-translocating P-type ATPase [Bryobacterales bacterium]|nr:cation-translocating P-type ATPase [Bryobacterales bacterium]
MLPEDRTELAYRQSPADVLHRLRTDSVEGLSVEEARARLARHGRNELSGERPPPWWKKFLWQFQNTLVMLLLAATVISTVLWIYERDSVLPYEAIAIFAIVLLNAGMGYFQTARAEQAIASLKAMTPPEASVMRAGRRQRVPAAELVPGDILLVEEGDTIAADARLIESTSLKTAEAALTGESLPVAKDTAVIPAETLLGDRHNMIFSGTVATYGRGTAVVVATGMQTEMGHIAGMLQRTPAETTPLQQQLDRTGKLLGLIVIAIAVVMVATLIMAEHVRGFSGIMEVLIFGVALAVAAVPEGLAAVVTAVLSLGVRRMARRNAFVRHLAAVETLGSADVIASDKTGTLTKNEMTARKVVTASGSVCMTGTGYDPDGAVTDPAGLPISDAIRSELERALTVADRANNALLQQVDGRWTVQGDPTEGALLVAARKAGLDPGRLEAQFVRVGEIPFSSERKLMSTMHKESTGEKRALVFTKGAPDVLLARCSEEFVGTHHRPLTSARRAEIDKAIEELAKDALRTLGVAYRVLPEPARGDRAVEEAMESDLVFAGLVGMIDPPREEAKRAVSRARRAGIRAVMITGDHPVTAAAIGKELGIQTTGRAVTGSELAQMSGEELLLAVQANSVYARVSPEHKLRIVEALQNNGAVVGMTGDGVNDAPALKRADIGIAMGITGTDVSKGVADMVLADDNFATIVAAVEEGRSIFTNIRKFLVFLLSSNIGEVLTMFFGVLLANVIGLKADERGLALPLTATQILWINFVTDGAPALALGLDPPDAGVMDKPPRPREEKVITGRMWAAILFVGAIMAGVTLAMLDAGLPGGLIDRPGDMRYAQTLAFNTIVLLQMFNIFNSRSEAESAFKNLFGNRWLWLVLAASLLLQMVVIYVPVMQQAFSTTALSLNDWLACAGAASSVLWLRELTKLVTRWASTRAIRARG